MDYKSEINWLSLKVHGNRRWCQTNPR